MKHIISIDDLSKQEIDNILREATYYKSSRKSGYQYAHILNNKLLLTDFYAPSTRTRFSFEAAMSYLGGSVIGSENAVEFSSVSKGENLCDNFRVISGYCDIIVGRFINEGDAKIAADVSLVPVINGGDGSGEHPTQALLDYFTINEYFRESDKITVTFLGDNLRGRTVHSLVKLLIKMNKVERVNFISHPLLYPPEKLLTLLEQYNIKYTNIPKMSSRLLNNTDVLYVTRMQNERGDIHLSNIEVSTYWLNTNNIEMLPLYAIILHPLPRNKEIPPVLDNDPRAKWFEQAWNGLYVRMSILANILEIR